MGKKLIFVINVYLGNLSYKQLCIHAVNNIVINRIFVILLNYNNVYPRAIKLKYLLTIM